MRVYVLTYTDIDGTSTVGVRRSREAAEEYADEWSKRILSTPDWTNIREWIDIEEYEVPD